jgi:hypothetical protein
MADDTVILRNYSGCDEVNDGGISYRVDKWGCVRVPEAAVAPLLRTGGFHRARPDDPSAIHSSLSDVEEVVWHLKPGRVRDTLMSLVSNTNQLNFLAERARPTVKII